MSRLSDCLSKGQLREVQVDPEKVAADLRSALSDLDGARASYHYGNWDQATTRAYFALYRACQAALLSRGFTNTNLYGLCVGLDALFAQPDHLPVDIAKRIREAKTAKDAAYEWGHSSAADARRVLGWTVEGVREILKTLAVPGVDWTLVEPDLPEPRQK